MLNIRLATENRKTAAERLAEITGTESHYTRVPRCAYEVGLYTIEKDGSITVAEGTDLQPLHTLVKEGLVEPFEAVAPETPPEELTPDADEDETAQEPVELTVSMPLTRHTGASLRNLLNLVYTRASLLNKALGTSFRVEPGLTDTLQDDACTLTVESLLSTVATYEDEHGKALDGITITPEEICSRTKFIRATSSCRSSTRPIRSIIRASAMRASFHATMWKTIMSRLSPKKRGRLYRTRFVKLGSTTQRRTASLNPAVFPVRSSAAAAGTTT